MQRTIAALALTTTAAVARYGLALESVNRSSMRPWGIRTIDVRLLSP